MRDLVLRPTNFLVQALESPAEDKFKPDAMFFPGRC
jgi:hypothetical protein